MTRSSSSPSWTRTCSQRFQRGHHRAGPRLRARGQVLGRLDAARRHALPDARLGACPSATTASGCCARRSPAASSPACPTASGTSSRRTCPFLEQDDLDRIEAAIRRVHVDRHRLPARPHRRRTRRRAGAGRRRAPAAAADRPRHHRPVRRQPARDRPVPLPQRQLLHAPGRRTRARPPLPGQAGGDAPAQPRALPRRGGRRTSTSSSSATTWACRPARRSRPPMYREFFKPRERADVADAPRNARRTSRSCSTAAAASASCCPT